MDSFFLLDVFHIAGDDFIDESEVLFFLCKLLVFVILGFMETFNESDPLIELPYIGSESVSAFKWSFVHSESISKRHPLASLFISRSRTQWHVYWTNFWETCFI